MLLKRVSSDVFPAYAGMIPGEGTQQERQFRVPRIRGDDPSPEHDKGLNVTKWCQ